MITLSPGGEILFSKFDADVDVRRLVILHHGSPVKAGDLRRAVERANPGCATWLIRVSQDQVFLGDALTGAGCYYDIASELDVLIKQGPDRNEKGGSNQ